MVVSCILLQCIISHCIEVLAIALNCITLYCTGLHIKARQGVECISTHQLVIMQLAHIIFKSSSYHHYTLLFIASQNDMIQPCCRPKWVRHICDVPKPDMFLCSFFIEAGREKGKRSEKRGSSRRKKYLPSLCCSRGCLDTCVNSSLCLKVWEIHFPQFTKACLSRKSENSKSISN